MRHIDDGFTYEFYEYEQDVINYYRKKSDYDTEESERRFREMKVALLDDEYGEMTFSYGTF